MSTDSGRMGFTRARDLLAVGLLAAVAGYLLFQFNYSRMPVLPRLAGLAAAVLGVAEGIFGLGLRSRITAPRQRDGAPTRPPVPPLVAARAVMTAKATSLAGSALGGLWLGLLLYVLPRADQVAAAGHDTTTSLIGLIGAVIMVGGALLLEFCCRAPSDKPPVDPLDR